MPLQTHPPPERHKLADPTPLYSSFSMSLNLATLSCTVTSPRYSCCSCLGSLCSMPSNFTLGHVTNSSMNPTVRHVDTVSPSSSVMNTIPLPAKGCGCVATLKNGPFLFSLSSPSSSIHSV